MVSLLSPFAISAGAGANNPPVSILSPSLLLNRISHVPIVRNPSHRYVHGKVSCDSAKGNPNSDPASDVGDTSLGKLDRRNLIFGVVGLCGATAAAVGIPDQIPFGALIPGFVNSRQQPRMKAEGTSSESGVARAVEPPKTATTSGGDFPITLNSAVRLQVPRPKKSRSKREKEDEEEVLLIKGIELDREKFVKFDVYINEEDDSARKPTSSGFAGSFVHLPQKQLKGTNTKKKTNLRLAMNELLEDVGGEDDDGLIVTIVPRAGADDLTIGGVEIEFLSE